MGLVGGSMMGPLMFILPPLFYARLRAMEPQLDLESMIPQTTEDVVTVALGTKEYTTVTRKNYYYVSPKKSNKFNNNRKTYKYSYEVLYDEDDIDTSTTSCLDRFLKKIKNNFLSLGDVSMENFPKIGPMVVWEKLKTAAIVSAGITATLLSTYFSLREAINYARFTPPCFVNVTAATQEID